MYTRNAQSWLKHFDFYILDVISFQIAYALAVFIRHHIWAYAEPMYRNFGIVLAAIDLIVLVLNNSMHQVVKRKNDVEMIETIKHCFLAFSASMIYFFVRQLGDAYSRIIVFVAFFLHILFGYFIRVLWKKVVVKYNVWKPNKKAMIVVTTPETAEEIVDRLSGDKLADYRIVGVVLNKESEQKTIVGYPIVSDIDGVAEYIVREWIDSVYIDAPLTDEKVSALMSVCAQMGVPTHYHVPNLSRNGGKHFSEKVGVTMVLTTSINYATPAQALIKRCFDLVAGFFGSILALVIIVIVGPIIKSKSPGPILFTQERIGKNGKRFKMYKIRSMYMDAEERKKELLAQNRVKDGMMFKLDFDPRIIGNEILPDGTKKTGIGEFIRKTSLDEFPQFFCVLRGVMSTVGTRPPTVDEWEKYEFHHRARLAIKPGITGMWQVSGRSEITDFEEVVKLDTEYITNWSIWLDLKILFKTVAVLFTRKGAM